ncbi:MAG: hypothetical protein HKP58_02880 [Desulfatitalea sp.]|nr:hypothetical protein [Desulfatitalea sp.]NNJ99335.1 hypothetical protein [Desulfatitalea sp.]
MEPNPRRPRTPAACRILINKTALNGLGALVKEVTVQLKRNVSGTATIVLDSFRDERGRWAVQDDDQIRPWSEVRINAVFDGRPESVLHGYIRDVKLEYPEEMSAAKVTVTVQDDLIKLDREQHHDVLTKEGAEKPDGAIVREICDAMHLAHEAEDGMTAGALTINATFAKFLLERAEANGYELFVRDQTLHFHPPAIDADPQPQIRVYAGPATNCIRFSAHNDGHRPDEVRVNREPEQKGDGKGASDLERVLALLKLGPNQPALGKHPLTSQGRGLPPFVWSMDCPMGATESEVEIRAQAKANENQFKITAEGVLDGSQYGHVLVPHLPVTVDGVGTTYAGRYYVDEVTHKFSKGVYEQHFKLLRNAVN